MATYLLALMLAGGVTAGNISNNAAATKSTAQKPAAQQKPVAQANELPVPSMVIESQLEDAQRNFRIKTYETFRKDRAEYDRRATAGQNALQAWIDAGSNPDDAPRLAKWFQKAEACSNSGTIAALPVAPKFIAVVTKPPVSTIAKKDATTKHDAGLQIKSASSATKSTEELPTKPVSNPFPTAQSGSALTNPPLPQSPSPPQALSRQIDAKDFKKFTSVPGRLTAEFPGDPSEADRVVPTPIGDVTVHTFTVETSAAEFMVAYADPPSSLAGAAKERFDVKRALTGTRDGIAKGTDTRPTSEREITLGKCPGREWEFAGNAPASEDFQWRCYYADTRQYQISVGWLKGNKPSKEIVDRFLNSLKLSAE